jgi:hypothetical protein
MQYKRQQNQQTKVCRLQTNGMVRHIHITVDDGTYDRLKAVKDDHGGT